MRHGLIWKIMRRRVYHYLAWIHRQQMGDNCIQSLSELVYTNLINLDLAGVPVMSSDRNGISPYNQAGGHCL